MSGPKEPGERRDGSGGDQPAESFGRRQYDHDPRSGERPPGPGYGRRDYDRPDDDDDGHGRRADDGDHEDGRDRNDRKAGNGHGREDGEKRETRDRLPPTTREQHGFHVVGLALVVIILVGALGAGVLYWRHHHRLAKERQARANQLNRGPRIFYTKVETQPAARELTVAADVRGFSQATLYAKVAGYVKSIAVDKGDAVHEGQLIGVLESPELDQQVAAAEADLVIKKRTFERYQKLVARDFVSAQDFETARAQYGVSEATLRQTKAFQTYKTLRAPFAGTVTARYVDPGALVPAATGSTQSALPMVDIADLRRLRITIFVQQDAAPFLHLGDPVIITVDERPDLKIKAAISRFAQALDTRSRMMLCEVWVDNTARLYPGTFVHATLTLQGQRTPQVPSSALLLHDNKPSVAVIRDGHVKFVTVRPGLDDGHLVQILDGLKPGELVALSLPAEIPDGATVQPVEQKKANQDGAKGAEASGVDRSGPQQQSASGGSGGSNKDKQKPGDDKKPGAKDKQPGAAPSGGATPRPGQPSTSGSDKAGQ